jgi:hypothetical protein
MIRIVSPYFVAGVIFKNTIVVRAAPIVKYMVGWHMKKVLDYCDKKDWDYDYIRSKDC